jgi:hypothetical protein
VRARALLYLCISTYWWPVTLPQTMCLAAIFSTEEPIQTHTLTVGALAAIAARLQNLVAQLLCTVGSGKSLHSTS